MSRNFYETTLEHAEQALFHIPAYDREIWLRMAFALFSEFGDAALELWLNWSQSADNYNKNDALRTWKSLKTGPITIGSLFFEARRHGWQPSSPYPKQLHATQRASKLELKVATEQAARQEVVRKKAVNLWHRNNPASPEHPYLTTKWVKPLNLRQFKDVLMVPLVDDHGLANIQFIQPDGTKRFYKGGKTKGTYCPIGKVENFIYVCEGWATGASIHTLTGEAVFCAMNAANLLPVAQMARAKYPNHHIILAGDNDTCSSRNIGAEAAREAALAVRGELMLPEFPKGHSGSDWNDWHVIQQGGAA